TKKAMTIHLPAQVVQLLKQWKAYQKSGRYNGPFLFPHPNKKDSADYNVVQKDLHAFSSGEWCSHDLRKCARICWEEQGVDGLVAERMLNHELGKTTRAYTGKAFQLRFAALKSHCLWLEKQKENCFILNPRSTPIGGCEDNNVILDAA
ncbi:MAG: tyrosine-type recombinase/integrase, partial [Alteromonadaceae bacterium]|nr:tyrosine-type recombinase/integrase [Alteromonadaceae bacterium]